MFHPRAPHLVLPLAALILAATVNPPLAYAAPEGIGTDVRAIPDRIFAESSFWYQQLPADAPLDPNSDGIVQAIKQAGINEYGNPERGLPSWALSTATPLAVAHESDPKIDIGFNNCEGKGGADPGFMQQMSQLNVPAGVKPGGGTDKETTLVNPEEDSVTDLWVIENPSSPSMSACWGGKIENASQSSGVFPAPYGSTGSGLPLVGGMVRSKELASGSIDHVVGVALPVSVVNSRVSTPANRTDGDQTSPNTISEGQLLRLPADLDIDSLHLSAPAKTMAKNAQRYGWIVWDRGGGNSFRIEDPSTLQQDPYPAILDGYQGHDALWGDPAKGHEPFPFDKLEVVQANYRTAEPASVSSSSSASTSSASASSTPTPSKTARATPQATPGSSRTPRSNHSPSMTTPAPQISRADRLEILSRILELLGLLYPDADAKPPMPAPRSSVPTPNPTPTRE